MPEGIAQIEKTVVVLDIPSLLESAFAVGGAVKSAVPHQHVLRAVQRPFFVKTGICNGFHRGSPLLCDGLGFDFRI